MPYIKQETRNELDVHIDHLIGIMQANTEDPVQRGISIDPGIANYVITRIVAGMKPERGNWRYLSLNAALGVFSAAASEFYRRLVAPYEDGAISKNGDLEEYNGQ